MREESAPSEVVSRMASVGDDHSCPPASAAKLQIRPVSCTSGAVECVPTENEIADAKINGEGTDTPQLQVVAVGPNVMLHQDIPNITDGHAHEVCNLSARKKCE